MRYKDRYHPSDMLVFRSLEEDEYEITENRLVNIRTRRFPKDHHVHMHYHNTLEIDVNRGISGTVVVDGIQEPLKEHQVYITPPGTMHSYFFAGGDGEFDVLHISLTRLNKLLDIEQLIGRPIGELPLQFDAYYGIPAIVDRFKTIPEDDLFTQLQVILDLFRIFAESHEEGHQIPKQLSWIKEIISFTEEHCCTPISLADIAKRAGFSESYVSRMFKKHTGTNYSSFLQLQRIKHASAMLAEGSSVTESCYSSGFENLSYFTQVFKKHHNGISPKDFRSKYLV